MYQNIFYIRIYLYLKDEEGNEIGLEVKEEKFGMKYYINVKFYLYL